MTLRKEQLKVCEKYGEAALFPLATEKLGVALSTIGKAPINGLRHPNEKGTCGWYIWCGEEMLEEEDFFKPLHVGHIEKYLPMVQKYLALPVGYRFLITENYEDIWKDDTIAA